MRAVFLLSMEATWGQEAYADALMDKKSPIYLLFCGIYHIFKQNMKLKKCFMNKINIKGCYSPPINTFQTLCFRPMLCMSDVSYSNANLPVPIIYTRCNRVWQNDPPNTYSMCLLVLTLRSTRINIEISVRLFLFF